MSVRVAQAEALRAAVDDVMTTIDRLATEASQCGFPIAANDLTNAWDQLEDASTHLNDLR